MTNRTHNFIDAATLMRIKSLELRARKVVEGFQTGLNRSPWHGFSVEFTEYRQYSPGDDPRYLDWKLYARSDRYFIKLFEDETNLRCHLLLDMSRSMEYGSVEYTKADYARTLAATLALFLTRQRDAVGLVRFSESVEEYVPARFRTGQLRRLMSVLDAAPTGTATDLVSPLKRVAEHGSRRGLMLLISDVLAPTDEWEPHLSWLSAQGHDVAVFQVLDPAELDFPFDKAALFRDAETGKDIHIDPAVARPEYQRQLEAHLASVREGCEKLGVTYRLFTTDTPLELALSEFLRHRANPASGGRQPQEVAGGGQTSLDGLTPAARRGRAA